MNTDPVVPKKQWACGLAALSWNLHRIGQPLNQEAIGIRIGAHFPHWNHYLGLLDLPDILRALNYLFLVPDKFILTNSKDELLSFYSANSTTYLMGFAQFRKPGSHIVGIDDWNEAGLTLMDAGYPEAKMRTKTWNDLAQEHDANFLFLFHSALRGVER